MKQEVDKLSKASDDRSEISTAFSNLSIANGRVTSSVPSEAQRPAIITRTWLAHIHTEKHSAQYLELRHKLSEASYWGHWETLFEVLDQGLQLYGESWVNAPRMSQYQGSDW
jgi:hypothetical protein